MDVAKANYLTKEIKINDQTMQDLANRYLQYRTDRVASSYSDTHAAIANLEGFSHEKIQKIIRENAKPKRIDPESRKPFNDIYRSDLGEMLMVKYFEEDYKKGNFKIPLKNLYDRELDNLPGRGFDAIGYKFENGKITLLLGEAKVSSSKKSPPSVVDTTDDSIYNTHCKHRDDTKYLEQRIANHAKKVKMDDRPFFDAILFIIANQLPNVHNIVYGCCLVRDHECVNPLDYGKMKTQEMEFAPNTVEFVIYYFDQKIQNAIDMFYDKVEAA